LSELKHVPTSLIGADAREDIIQEGMIGRCTKAIPRLPSQINWTSFRCLPAELVHHPGQIITAIKTATRQKHIPLNSYVSLNKPIYDEESDRTPFWM